MLLENKAAPIDEQVSKKLLVAGIFRLRLYFVLMDVFSWLKCRLRDIPGTHGRENMNILDTVL